MLILAAGRNADRDLRIEAGRPPLENDVLWKVASGFCRARVWIRKINADTGATRKACDPGRSVAAHMPF